MYKDVIVCNKCKYFFINPEGICMCNSEKGIAFPKTDDYCSYGEPAQGSREIDNSAILEMVYKQRRNG